MADILKYSVHTYVKTDQKKFGLVFVGEFYSYYCIWFDHGSGGGNFLDYIEIKFYINYLFSKHKQINKRKFYFV